MCSSLLLFKRISQERQSSISLKRISAVKISFQKFSCTSSDFLFLSMVPFILFFIRQMFCCFASVKFDSSNVFLLSCCEGRFINCFAAFLLWNSIFQIFCCFSDVNFDSSIIFCFPVVGIESLCFSFYHLWLFFSIIRIMHFLIVNSILVFRENYNNLH